MAQLPHRVFLALSVAMCTLTLLLGPMANSGTKGWGMALLVALGAATTVLTALTALFDPKTRVRGGWAAVTVLFLVLVWASVSWSIYTFEALRWAAVWTAVLGTALSVHYLAQFRLTHYFLGVILVSNLVVLTFSYLLYRGYKVPFFESVYDQSIMNFATGPYFNPSHFSGYLIFSSALCLGVMLHRKFGLLNVLLLGMLVFTQWINIKTDASSIPAVLLTIPVALLVWLVHKHLRAGLVVLTAALALGVVGTLGFLSPQGQAYFNKYKSTIGISNNWVEFLERRQAVWSYPVRMWEERPLTGMGMGQFAVLSPNYRRDPRTTKSQIDQMHVNYAHNDMLQIGSELGAIGAVLFVLLVGLALWGRANTVTLTAVTATVCFFFAGIYDAHLTAIPSTMLVFFAFLGLAQGSQLEQQRQSNLTVDSGTTSRNNDLTER